MTAHEAEIARRAFVAGWHARDDWPRYCPHGPEAAAREYAPDPVGETPMLNIIPDPNVSQYRQCKVCKDMVRVEDMVGHADKHPGGMACFGPVVALSPASAPRRVICDHAKGCQLRTGCPHGEKEHEQALDCKPMECIAGVLVRCVGGGGE
ncbi:MAG: hypothetical protein WC683_04275 [bacterium]